MRFVDLKLKVKFFWAFSILILIGLFVSINAIYTLSRFEKGFGTLITKAMNELEFTENITTRTRQAAYFMQSYMLTGTTNYYDQAIKELEALSRELEEGEQILKKTSELADLGQKIDISGNLVSGYINLIQKAHENNEDAAVVLTDAENARSKYMDQCLDAMDTRENLLRQEIARGTTSKSRSVQLYTLGQLLGYGYEINLLVNTADIWNMEKQFENIRSLFDEIGKNINLLKINVLRNDNVSAIDDIERLAADYKNDLLDLADNMKKQSEIFRQHQDLTDKLVSNSDELRDYLQSDSLEIAKSFSGTRVQKMISYTFFMLIVVGIALFASIYISRLITKSLYKGVDFAQSISKGDLTVRLDIDQKDEIGVLASNLQQMSEMIRQTIAAVTTAADNMANASLELSSTSQNVSQGASEQASSAEEVSSAIEEMTASIQQNAENAKATEKISAKVEADIIDGKEKVVKTVKAIREISDKISIIGDIAFQTNILALNAAVEAARAGEQGRGFGVVAAEVGKLAERSKIAALEIDRLTKVSVSNAEEAGTIMNEIVPEIQKTTDLIRGIVVASVQQNAGADQINMAIQQLNQVTQQNAAASEELATNAVELSTQAENLQQTVSFFKVVKNGTARIPNTGYKRHALRSPAVQSGTGRKGVVLNLDDDPDNEFERF